MILQYTIASSVYIYILKEGGTVDRVYMVRKEKIGRADWRRTKMGLGLGWVVIRVVIMVTMVGGSEIDKDKEKCGKELVGLSPCLAYVSGESTAVTAPPTGCCAGLKQVLHNNPQCLCLLVKDRNDPSVGFKINATIALNLPSQCHSPANISDCPAVLHLPPNSPDAKVFEEFGNSGNKAGGGGGKAASSSSSSSSSGSGGGDMNMMSSSSSSSGNGKGKRRISSSNIEALLLVLVSIYGWVA